MLGRKEEKYNHCTIFKACLQRGKLFKAPLCGS